MSDDVKDLAKPEVLIVVDKWQKRLGMRDYVLNVEVVDDLRDDAFAVTHRNAEAMAALIKFRKDFYNPPFENPIKEPDLEHTVIHELLHIKLGPLVDQMKYEIDRLSGTTMVQSMLDSMRSDLEERFVDGLANGLIRWENGAYDD